MDRFWSKVDKGESCWEWTAYVSDGYGRFLLDGEPVRAHRLAYTMCVGPIPEGMVVRHTCDNRKCVNPKHLVLGSVADNNRDTVERRRNNNQKKTVCANGHAFEGNNFYVDGKNKRICRVCKREKSAAKRLARVLDRADKEA